MKNYNKDIRIANRYLRSRHFTKAIRYLEPKAPLYKDDTDYLNILGIACFHIGDIGGAELYLKKSYALDPENTDILLYRAAVNLKKKDMTEAIRIYLNILDQQGANAKASKGLEAVKKITRMDELSRFLKSRQFADLLPSLGINPWRIIIPVMMMCFLVLFVPLAVMKLPDLISNWKQETRSDQLPINKGLTDLPLLDFTAESYIILTETEVEDSYNRLVRYFNNYQDNKTQIEINRLLNSNASSEIKSRALLYEGLLQDPTFPDFQSELTYSMIKENPLLYNNCHIRWKGRVTNLRVEETEILFDFLIGYEDGAVLEGIVPVSVPFEAKIDPTYPIEMIGRLETTSRELKMVCVALHPIIPE